MTDLQRIAQSLEALTDPALANDANAFLQQCANENWIDFVLEMSLFLNEEAYSPKIIDSALTCILHCVKPTVYTEQRNYEGFHDPSSNEMITSLNQGLLAMLKSSNANISSHAASIIGIIIPLNSALINFYGPELVHGIGQIDSNANYSSVCIFAVVQLLQNLKGQITDENQIFFQIVSHLFSVVSKANIESQTRSNCIVIMTLLFTRCPTLFSNDNIQKIFQLFSAILPNADHSLLSSICNFIFEIMTTNDIAAKTFEASCFGIILQGIQCANESFKLISIQAWKELVDYENQLSGGHPVDVTKSNIAHRSEQFCNIILSFISQENQLGVLATSTLRSQFMHTPDVVFNSSQSYIRKSDPQNPPLGLIRALEVISTAPHEHSFAFINNSHQKIFELSTSINPSEFMNFGTDFIHTYKRNLHGNWFKELFTFAMNNIEQHFDSACSLLYQVFKYCDIQLTDANFVAVFEKIMECINRDIAQTSLPFDAINSLIRACSLDKFSDNLCAQLHLFLSMALNSNNYERSAFAITAVDAIVWKLGKVVQPFFSEIIDTLNNVLSVENVLIWDESLILLTEVIRQCPDNALDALPVFVSVIHKALESGSPNMVKLAFVLTKTIFLTQDKDNFLDKYGQDIANMIYECTNNMAPIDPSILSSSIEAQAAIIKSTSVHPEILHDHLHQIIQPFPSNNQELAASICYAYRAIMESAQIDDDYLYPIAKDEVFKFMHDEYVLFRKSGFRPSVDLVREQNALLYTVGAQLKSKVNVKLNNVTITTLIEFGETQEENKVQSMRILKFIRNL